jgi:hypothetical protein
MEIVLNSKFKEIESWIDDVLKDDIIFDKSVTKEFVIYYYCSKHNIFRISSKIYDDFYDRFSKYYYSEKDFRKIVKDFLKSHKNLHVSKVWIGC